MEKEPLKALVGNIQKFSTEDGPGIRTTIFLKGCPLACRWCHNPDLIRFEQQLIRLANNCIGCGYCDQNCSQGALSMGGDGKVQVEYSRCHQCMNCTKECYAQALQPVATLMTVEEILKEAEQDKGFYEHTGGGITVSGGEMLAHSAFVEELIDSAAERGIRACLDTCGFGDGVVLERLAEKQNVTNILFDMKAIDRQIHKEYTGQENKTILDNLRRLAVREDINPKIIMRMPLIAGVNDSQDMIEQAGAFYKANRIKKVTLLPYHDLGRSKERNIGGNQSEFQPPSEERVKEIQQYFENKVGMEVEILGKL